jgi:hypothetical protein
VLGLEPEFMVLLASDADVARARAMTYDDLAREALAAKEIGPRRGASES